MGIIAKQGIVNTIYSYIGVLLGFISILIQPYFIEAHEIGINRLLLSVFSISAIFIPLGIGSLTQRFFPKIKNPENGHQGHFFILIAFCLLGLFIFDALIFLFETKIKNYYAFKSPLFLDYYYLLYIIPTVIALVNTFTIYSASLFKTSFAVFLNDILSRALQIVTIFLYYFHFLSSKIFVVCFVSISLVQLVLLTIYIFRIDKISFKINWNFYKSFFTSDVLLFSFLMMVTAFASIGIRSIDTMIMGHYLSLDDIGVYTTSIFIAAVMDVPINNIERISTAVAANSWASNDFENIKKMYYDSVRLLMFVGGYLMCGIICCSHEIFQILPASFSAGRVCMMLIAISGFINLSTGINNSIIATSHKYFVITIFLILLIITSIITNNIFIKQFGIAGAALSTLISMGSFNLLKVIYLWWRLKLQPYNRKTTVIFIFTIITTLLVYMIPLIYNPIVSIAIKGSIISLVYLFLLIKFKVGEEIRLKIPIINKINL